MKLFGSSAGLWLFGIAVVLTPSPLLRQNGGVVVVVVDALMTPQQQQHRLSSHAKPKTTATTLKNVDNVATDYRGGSASAADESGGTATIPNEVFNLVKSIVGAG